MLAGLSHPNSSAHHSTSHSHANTHHSSAGHSATAGSNSAEDSQDANHSTHTTHSTSANPPATPTRAATTTAMTTPYATLDGLGSAPIDTSGAIDNSVLSSDADFVSPCGCWKGNSVESFQWLDIDKKARDMYIDIKYSHDFKVRGGSYMADKKKVTSVCTLLFVTT